MVAALQNETPLSSHMKLWQSALAVTPPKEDGEGDDVEILMHEAVRATLAIKRICHAADNSTVALMQGIWEVFNQQLYTYAGEYNTIREYIDGEIVPHVNLSADHIQEKGLYASEIFSWLKMKPVNDLVSGDTITVDMLIGRPRVVAKLRAAVFIFQKIEDAQRRQLISAIYNDSLPVVKKLVKEIKGEADGDGEDGDETVKFVASKSINADGTVNYTFLSVSETKAAIIETLLGDEVDFEFAEIN